MLQCCCNSTKLGRMLQGSADEVTIFMMIRWRGSRNLPEDAYRPNPKPLVPAAPTKNMTTGKCIV